MDGTSSSRASKLLIVAMLLICLVLAVFSWWFRFTATNHAARFWGPDAVRLVRDAPRVEACRWTPDGDVKILGRPAVVRDVSHARGMVHLRNALLEDRSFDWETSVDPQTAESGYALRFRDDQTNKELWVFFSPDFRTLRLVDGPSVGTAPIAEGLAIIFTELFPAED
jgi:hypothetical protein